MKVLLSVCVMQVWCATMQQKGHRHAGGRVALSAERFENKTCIDVGRRDEATTGQHAAHFCRPREPIRVLLRLRLRPRPPPRRIIRLLFVFVLFCLFLLRETTKRKAIRRSRGRRRKTRRCRGERNDSSRRRAVLPRTSHPWFPPALEPLNHSVVQRFEASVVLNANEQSRLVENDENE